MATKKVKTATKKVSPLKTKISSAEIQRRAEQIYLSRVHAGAPGDELSDWLQAEKELKRN